MKAYLDDELDDVDQGGVPGDQDLLEAQELLPVQLLVGLVWVDTQCKENSVSDYLFDL